MADARLEELQLSRCLLRRRWLRAKVQNTVALHFAPLAGEFKSGAQFKKDLMPM
jgi:hypothetical protein